MRNGAGAEVRAHFIRLEHLQEDLRPFADHLGLRLNVPRANGSERSPDWRGYYSAEDAQLVADLCAEDVARFSYGFDDYRQG